MTLTFQTLTHYDPGMDGEATVYICHSGKGAYWIRVPTATAGRKRRAQKEEVHARIEDAIENEQAPGEVSMDGPRPERLDAIYDPGEY